MANPWITDLNHLLKAEHEATPRNALLLRGHLTAIVKAATALAARSEKQTALRCPGKSERSPCPGHLMVRLQDIPSEIHWRCQSCGGEGVILNWPNSPWDLSLNGEGPANGAAGPECTVLVDAAHFQELCKIDFMDPRSERAVFSARPEKGKVALSGSVEVFEDILGELASEANYECQRARQKRLDRLLQSLNADPDLNSALAVNGSKPVASASGAQSRSVDLLAFPDLLPDDFISFLESSLQNGDTAGVEELNQRLAEIADYWDDEPIPGSEGLSARQLQTLLRANWESARGAVRFCETLPAQEVERCAILQNVRPFLLACQRGKGAAMTAAGNLKRSFVEQMFWRLPASQPWRDKHRQCRKVWNEADFSYLHLLRLLCGLAGLLRPFKKRFRLTRKGQRLLQPGQSSALFATLFVARFQKLNLACLDRLPENDALQATISYSLYVLSRQDRSWHSSQQLAPRLTLPAARKSSCAFSEAKSGLREVESRILEPLVQFGLLDSCPVESSRCSCSAFEVRKTPLFDRFIRFQLDEA
ncbi:MAG: hypothetical protein V3T83_00835 [Acidobacteriota bacterium]